MEFKNVDKKVISITLDYDDGPETAVFVFAVPAGTEAAFIRSEIRDMHTELCDNGSRETIYDACGRTPETLAKQVCMRNGWHCENVFVDVEIRLG